MIFVGNLSLSPLVDITKIKEQRFLLNKVVVFRNYNIIKFFDFAFDSQ